MRSKHLQHLLHLGHTQNLEQAKGNWQPHNKPTGTARNQRSVQLSVGIHPAELNRSALNWADSVGCSSTASTTAREAARRISIEQRFRSIAGKHATALAFILMLLIIAFSLTYSFYPYHTGPAAAVCSYLNEFHVYASTYVPPQRAQLPDPTRRVGHATTRVPSRQGEAPHLAAQQQLLELRNAHWDLVAEASSTGDHKEYTKDPAWRASITAAHSALLHAAPVTDEGPLSEVTQIVRSFHPGRALPCTNPTKLASVLQPAIDEGLITQARADELIEIARNGISATEFRNLDGPALDLSGGNTTDPVEEGILLDFYFAQAGKSRVLVFPQTDAEYLETLAAVVLSPSFLAYAPGKAPRPILNLSSHNDGVNQRMDDLAPETNGYSTIPKIAEHVVLTYVDMVRHPA